MHTASTSVTPAPERLTASPVRFHEIGPTTVAYRCVGAGPPVVFLHGWPLSGLTYRAVIDRLAERFTCYAVDLAGAGETRCGPGTDYSFTGQAELVRRLIDALDLRTPDVVAHDTGGTIARAVAVAAGDRLGRLVLIGTEIPGHRPPWIPLFQRLAALPGARATFQLLLASRAFVRSSMGFGNCFVDRELIDGDFTRYFIRPLLESPQRMEGQIRYLRGIEWGLVDRLAEDHRRIANPVLLIWGEQDSIFPVRRARAIAAQLPDCRGFVEIAGAKLLPHEEQPAVVARQIAAFLGGAAGSATAD